MTGSVIRPPAYFGMPIADFVAQAPAELLGTLAGNSEYDIVLAQRGAWENSVEVLRSAIAGVEGYVYLEFDVPRLGSRIDAVVISGPAIFPIEFKVGEASFPNSALNQAWDYGLDLKNFHRASHEVPVLPILVCTDADHSDGAWEAPHADGVRRPYRCNSAGLAEALRSGLALAQGAIVDPVAWGRSPYHPTPTIIEAAQALYAQHSVEAISRHDAGARNLAVTSKCVEDLIDEARAGGHKSIIFITGVPGAGKTLVGLNVATRRRDTASESHAVFLSGNGPLVAVLQEALVRDEFDRRKAVDKSARKGAIAQPVKQFIQIVHHFRDAAIKNELEPPSDHVAIFDEAQRAWNQAATSNFMQRRKRISGFNQSEPQFLIGYMDRHADWAVIVCLVGGGQEINAGEAGIATWLDAVRDHYDHWHVYISPRLKDSEYEAMDTIEHLPETMVVRRNPDLHLAVSMRSFRAERVSEFVKSVLDLDTDSASTLLGHIATRYPMALTRDLDCAKDWIRGRARGTERYGLVASSEAMRLKPHAIDVRVKTDPVHYFLNPASDTRSSYFMEDPATEFQIQGLELDWVCMTWDADLRRVGSGWRHFQFRGGAWQRRHKEVAQRYLINAYRVLLTRARQGMVIFVPRGNAGDPTRDPRFYDGTYRYLQEVGIVEVR